MLNSIQNMCLVLWLSCRLNTTFFHVYFKNPLYPIDLTVVPSPELIPLPKKYCVYEPNLRKLVINHKGNIINLRSIKSTSLLTSKVLKENVSISLML